MCYVEKSFQRKYRLHDITLSDIDRKVTTDIKNIIY